MIWYLVRGHSFSTYAKFYENGLFWYCRVTNVSFSENFTYVLNDSLFYLCCQYIGSFMQVVIGLGGFIIRVSATLLKCTFYLGGKVPNAWNIVDGTSFSTT